MHSVQSSPQTLDMPPGTRAGRRARVAGRLNLNAVTKSRGLASLRHTWLLSPKHCSGAHAQANAQSSTPPSECLDPCVRTVARAACAVQYSTQAPLCCFSPAAAVPTVSLCAARRATRSQNFRVASCATPRLLRVSRSLGADVPLLQARSAGALVSPPISRRSSRPFATCRSRPAPRRPPRPQSPVPRSVSARRSPSRSAR